MKLSASEADRIAKNPPKDMIAALVFGPDIGLVHERAENLLKSVVPDLSDPFRVADLDEGALIADPARLSDEAAALSMMGGRRVVRVRGSGAGLAKIFAEFLSDPKGDALVVIEGGDLAKSSPLRKLFEDAKNAAAIACYADTPRDLAEVVRQALRDENLSIDQDALAEAVTRLGGDRGTTRRELEKLILYVQGQKQVTLADIRNAIGDEADIRIDEAIDAAASGDQPRLDLAIERLWSADISPIAVVRQTLSHFQRLLQVKAEVSGGEVLDSAIRKLRPPLHFSRATAFRAQLQRWPAARLMDALEQVFETERLCKTTAVPAEAVCGQTLLQLALMARSQGR